MEQNEISIHEIEVYRAFQAEPSRWFTNHDLAALMKTCKPRTVRAKTAKFVSLGLVDQAEVFPSHRYRWSDKAKQRNLGYLQRLEKANEVFSDF